MPPPSGAGNCSSARWPRWRVPLRRAPVLHRLRPPPAARPGHPCLLPADPGRRDRSPCLATAASRATIHIATTSFGGPVGHRLDRDGARGMESSIWGEASRCPCARWSRAGRGAGDGAQDPLGADAAGRCAAHVADLTRSASELGYQPRAPFPEGLRRFAAWMKEARGRQRDHLIARARERFVLQDYYGAIHLLEEVVTSGPCLRRRAASAGRVLRAGGAAGGGAGAISIRRWR